MTKYFLINKKFELISGCDYGSAEAAKAAIEKCNIPKEDAEVRVFSMSCLNECYIHPENYINNPNSKIRPGDYNKNLN